MLRFIAIRLAQAIPVLFVVATLTFFMLKLAPGGPFSAEKNTTLEIQKQLEAHYGLNKPLLSQYFTYLGNVVRGDLGPSFKYPNRTVNELIGQAFPVSAELGFWSLLVALSLGLSAGVIASLRPNSLTDYIPSGLAMVGICLPILSSGRSSFSSLPSSSSGSASRAGTTGSTASCHRSLLDYSMLLTLRGSRAVECSRFFLRILSAPPARKAPPLSASS